MKKINSFAIMLLAAALTTAILTSCEGDGFDEHTVGNLEGDNTFDLPLGYRVRTVGDISYGYKSNGKLDFIRMNGEKLDMSGKTLERAFDDGTGKYTFKFNAFNNLEKIEYKMSDSEASEEATAKFRYFNRQLSSIEVESEGKFLEDGHEYKYTYNADFDFSYNDQCLRRMKMKSTELGTDNGEEKTLKITRTYNFKYDDTSEFYNRYYQWTPNVAHACFDNYDDILVAMAYVGLLGRASRQLPYAILCETEGKAVDGGDIEEEESFDCEYAFNSYDAIRMADGINYTYTERSDDYEVKGSSFDFDTRSTSIEHSPLNIGLFKHMHRHNLK